MRRKPGMAIVVASIGLCSACAHQVGRTYGTAPVRDGASMANVVTASDLASGGEGRTVLTALQQVRPSFLGMPGRLPAVLLDETLVTDVSILSMLTVSAICEIRLQRGTSGAGHPLVLSDGSVSSGGDVLRVRTRRQGTTDCRRDPVSQRFERGSLERH
jgi:hypothetical protein